MYVQTLRFPGHPQEIAENSVDLAHLRYIHGYDSVNRVEPASIDGHHMVSRFDFTSRRKVARVATLTFEISADTDIYGLGYSFVSIREHTIGMDMRLWILATPVDGELVDMTLASQVREIRNPKRLLVGLGFLPTRLRAPLMNRFMASRQRQDVLDDVVIWGRKKYVSPPRLNRSDGEIMAYRAYCAQFYADPNDCSATS
ncbi:MAG: hypothetical protein F4Z25_10070 [Chloroflexi bacterium]|nr:hypothetical protein [Chloroflexota bacterium]